MYSPDLWPSSSTTKVCQSISERVVLSLTMNQRFHPNPVGRDVSIGYQPNHILLLILGVYCRNQGFRSSDLLDNEHWYRRSRLKLGDAHPHTFESINNLINLYEAWNKPEKAEEWLAKLEQIEDFEEWHVTT